MGNVRETIRTALAPSASSSGLRRPWLSMPSTGVKPIQDFDFRRCAVEPRGPGLAVNLGEPSQTEGPAASADVAEAAAGPEDAPIPEEASSEPTEDPLDNLPSSCHNDHTVQAVANINPAEKVVADPQQTVNPDVLGLTLTAFNNQQLEEKVGKDDDKLNGPRWRDAEVVKEGPFRHRAFLPTSLALYNQLDFVVRIPMPPSGGVWSTKTSQSVVRKLHSDQTRVADLCGGGATILHVQPTPGLVSAIERHEDRHVADIACAFGEIVDPWAEKARQHQGQDRGITAKTALGARIKLFRALGGTRRRITRKFLRRMFKDSRDFHLSNEGKGPRIGEFRVKQGCSEVLVSLEPPEKG